MSDCCPADAYAKRCDEKRKKSLGQETVQALQDVLIKELKAENKRLKEELAELRKTKVKSTDDLLGI